MEKKKIMSSQQGTISLEMEFLSFEFERCLQPLSQYFRTSYQSFFFNMESPRPSSVKTEIRHLREDNNSKNKNKHTTPSEITRECYRECYPSSLCLRLLVNATAHSSTLPSYVRTDLPVMSAHSGFAGTSRERFRDNLR